MNKLVIFLFCLLFVFSSVLAQQKKQALNNSLSRPGLYLFHATTDTTFCNEDSLVGSDCAGGELYFSKSGNLIYRFICCCENQDSYLVGTYVVAKDSIICSLTKEYTYKGRIKKIDKWIFPVKKITCESFEFKFDIDYEGENKEIMTEVYVLRKSSKEDQVDFIAEVRRIKFLLPYLE